MTGASKRRRNDEALARAEAYVANPASLADDMRAALLNIEDVAPGLAAAALERAAVAAQFLASRAPKTWSDPLGRITLTDKHSQAKFDRYAETVLDPMTTLLRLENGTLSLEHAEALREVYPDMYADLQQRVMDAMIEAESIPYQARIQAGVLFGQPADASMFPEMVLMTQQALAAPSQPQQPQAPSVRPGGAQSLRGTAALNTGASRIESGGERI